MPSIDQQLQHLADTIDVPREEDGTPARLLALMPCEPAIGEVVVACWADSDEGELIELLRLDDGTRVDDQVALRESLTLLAMVETVEELASFDELAPLRDALSAWRADDGSPLPDPFVRAREQALTALEGLLELAPGESARVARPGLLDRLGAALRELERTWELLEQAAELWSDAQIAAHPNERATLERVQGLWRVLGIARRGPLLRPISGALHDGREAGVAMAASIADAAGSG